MAEDTTVYYIYVVNDQYFRCVLKNGETDAFLDDAQSVSITLKDKNGLVVEPVDSIPLTKVDGVSGLYRGIVPHDFNPPIGIGYFMWLNIVTATGLIANIRKRFKVDVRTN